MDDDIDELIKTLAGTPDTAALAKAQELLTKLKIENPKIKELEAAFAKAKGAPAASTQGQAGTTSLTAASTAAPVVKLTDEESKLIDVIKAIPDLTKGDKKALDDALDAAKDGKVNTAQLDILKQIDDNKITDTAQNKLIAKIKGFTASGGRRKRHKSRKNRKLKKYKSKKRR